MKYGDINIPEQIASHSSALTNLRISKVLEKIDAWKEESWARPNVPNIQRYFANIYSLFDNVFMLLHEEELSEIKDNFAAFWKIFNGLADRKNENIRSCFALLFCCDEINRVLRVGLQKYEYFFRIGTREPKKIEEALRIIKVGGGIFGGRIESV